MSRWTLHLEGGTDRCEDAAVAVGNKVFSFGGSYRDNESHIEVNVFDTVTLRWMKLPRETAVGGERHLEVPSWRKYHTAVLVEDTVYIWGGYNGFSRFHCDVLYAFDVDGNRWFKPGVSGPVPGGREDHSAGVLEKVMFIHGGYTMVGLWPRWTNDIYKLDTSTMVWSSINTGGNDSYRQSATIIGTKLFVFGGQIRVFDTQTNHWMNTPSTQLLPEGLWAHSAFTYNGELYIFGGLNGKGHYFNDMWKLNPETFSWKKVEPTGKGPHKMKYMCCCTVGDRIILFGAENRPGDLYVLDFSPSLKTLCKLAVIQYGLEKSGLPHNIRWELAAMTSNNWEKITLV